MDLALLDGGRKLRPLLLALLDLLLAFDDLAFCDLLLPNLVLGLALRAAWVNGGFEHGRVQGWILDTTVQACLLLLSIALLLLLEALPLLCLALCKLALLDVLLTLLDLILSLPLLDLALPLLKVALPLFKLALLLLVFAQLALQQQSVSLVTNGRYSETFGEMFGGTFRRSGRIELRDCTLS